ncbi:MAG: hypothetical protein U1F43_13550 [Myxococcota bacterium]
MGQGRFGRTLAGVWGGGLLLWSGAAQALPPGGVERGFVEGANHHVGDESFVERFGRAPDASDAEALRMHTHLAWIRAELGRRPATKPELAARRATILGYLDEYIAKGKTPLNVDLAWRNPVFIDALGQICAVGYLIERDAGRGLAEAIAAAHRFDYIDDIAREMPAVAAWIEGSGLTLEEIASIQPGYDHPQIDNWELRPTTPDGGGIVKGEGHWQSRYGNGVLLAEGDFHRGHPSGRWRFFHPSGNLAAEGSFQRGVRVGAWRFYDDSAAHTLVSAGSFEGGGYAGRWKHYDRDGKAVAETYDVAAGPRSGDALPEQARQAHRAGDRLSRSVARAGLGAPAAVRVGPRGALVSFYDTRGRALAKADDGRWVRTTCREERAFRRALTRGSIDDLHGGDASQCATTEPVPAGTAAALDRLVAARAAPQPLAPAYLDRLFAETERAIARMRGEEPEPETVAAAEPAADATTATDAQPADAAADKPAGLFDLLADGMTWYVELGHVDRLFELVFATLPDRVLDDGFPDPPDEPEDGSHG